MQLGWGVPVEAEPYADPVAGVPVSPAGIHVRILD
jgi:hypothetical protein